MPFRGVDYLLIDSQFSRQELLVRQNTRRFVDERVLPLLRDSFRNATAGGQRAVLCHQCVDQHKPASSGGIFDRVFEKRSDPDALQHDHAA